MKKKNRTYASIVETAIKETTPSGNPIINLTEKTCLKLVFLILEAHAVSLGDGRPYNEILKESLKLNDIDVKIPNKDSKKIYVYKYI